MVRRSASSRTCALSSSIRKIFFLLFIPPLLFSDGWLFPKREFLKYRHSILLLAFGLVAATVLVVGYTMYAVLPEIPLAAWFALGAVISPTDAVVVNAITEHSWAQLVGYALLVSAIVIVTRLVWIFPSSRIALWLAQRRNPDLKPARWRDVFVAGWAGLRGAVTLAAALSIPLAAAGAAFPGRDLLIFLASSVIIITLVFNGLTLPLLIRWFGIKGDNAAEREERAARIAAAQAAIRKLRKLMDHQDDRAEREFTMQLIADYERRIEEIKEEYGEDGQHASPRLASERAIRLAAVEAERVELQNLLNKGRINEQVLFVIQRELDHLESVLQPRVEGA